jgi:hypothetical protein
MQVGAFMIPLVRKTKQWSSSILPKFLVFRYTLVTAAIKSTRLTKKKQTWIHNQP